MGKEIEVRARQVWEFTPRAPVVRMAMSLASGLALAADEEGTAYVLDRQGGLEGTIALRAHVTDVCATPEGRLFAVVDEKGKVVAFGADGKPLWAVTVGQGVPSIDIDRSGRRLVAARPPYSIITVSPGAHEKELKCHHRVASVALVEGPPDSIAAAGELGELSFMDTEGGARWQYSLGTRSGRVRISPAAGIVTLPVYEEGVQSFTLEGAGAGAFDVGQSVTVAAAAASPVGTVLALLTDENGVMLMNMDGLVLWHQRFDAGVADFCITDDASMIVASVGGRRLVGFAIEVPGPTPSHAGPAQVGARAAERPPETGSAAATAGAAAIEEAPAAEKEPVVPAGTPRPQEAVLVAEREFASGAGPKGLDCLAVTPGGQFALAALSDGFMIALDRRGNTVVEARLDGPAQVRKKRSDGLLAAWNPRVLVGVEFGTAQVWTLPLGPVAARLLDCTEDLSLISLVDERDHLVILRRDGTEAGRYRGGPGAVRLLMTPTAGTVLTMDAEGRLRFFDAEANLRRKQRMAGGESFDQVVLEDGFCAFGGSEGRVVMQDVNGKVLWAAKVLDSVERLESLEHALAVYGSEGKCLVLSPYGDIVAEFSPPPGQCALRTAPGTEPVLLHARRNVLTAFGGYQRKLDALWRFECREEIEFFEADRSGSLVAVVAGRRLCLVERPANRS